MVFSSTVFLFIFLPLVFFLYYLGTNSTRNAILLIASLFFYAWGEPKYIAVLIVSIIINYFGGLGIDYFKEHLLKKKIALIVTITLNLLILIYFKYFNFLIDNFNVILDKIRVGTIPTYEIIMPIGISFFTFQALSYVIDVYRGQTVVQKSGYKLALYISLFPQLIAGPIVRYHDIYLQIDNRTTDFDKLSSGLKRFIIGLGKKVLIANSLGQTVDVIFSKNIADISTTSCWLAIIAYSLQLYYDFSGYSDMAIGLGKLFGFDFLENFNYPYISKSITEFWRRWHISLSTWFKEYVYFSLGGNRVKPYRVFINLWIVFLITGIWHGASWNFIVWGMWHGLFIMLEKFKFPIFNKVPGYVKHIYLLLVVIVGWVFFRSENLTYAFQYLRTMFGFVDHSKALYSFRFFMNSKVFLFLIIGILGSMPFVKNFLYKFDYEDVSIKWKLYNVLQWLCVLVILITSMLSIATSSYNPFIYFRF